MINKIVIGSRGSKLAVIQAQSVVAKLREIRPGIDVSIKKITTVGDRDLSTLLENWGQAGVFVKELEQALLDRTIDLAVHSLKDMPTDIPEELYLAAVTERQDPRDALVAGAPLDELPKGSLIGTGSLRRNVQLRNKRPDIKVIGIRGNIDTRLRKIENGDVDGIIIAAAALLRLGRGNKITEYLPVSDFLPEAGQAALAVEARTGDPVIAEITASINDIPTWQSTAAERAFLKSIGAGCIAPVAALATFEGDLLHLEGMVADVETGKMLRAYEEGEPSDSEGIGLKLAQKMISMGATQLVDKARLK